MSIQDLVSKPLDTIRQEMFDNLSAKQEEYVAAGWLPIRLNLNKGIVRGMIELWCWGLWQLYQFLALILIQATPAEATGLWLDLWCLSVNVFRKEATKASGVVYFTRTGVDGNVRIPVGRIVRTLPDGNGEVFRFVTTEEVILLNGTSEIACPVIAEEYGSGSNVTVDQICEIVTIIPGIDAVENRSDWLISEATNRETDSSLRKRYTLAWQGLSGCTKYAYESWAMAVTGVMSVKILDQHPRGQGTVDVIVVGAAGIPTQALLDAVTVKILGSGNNDDLIPINDDVEIKGPTPINIDITAELILIAGDPDTILADAENRVRALFNTDSLYGIDPLSVGYDATLDRIKAVMMLSGVKKITLTSPLADVAVPIDGLAVLNSLTLTTSWTTEL